MKDRAGDGPERPGPERPGPDRLGDDREGSTVGRDVMLGRTSIRQRWRDWLVVAALAALVVALVPPLAGAATHYVVLETVQYSLLAVCVPALVALGAPWQALGLASAFERLDLLRLRRSDPTILKTLIWLAPILAVLGLWRAPFLVDALARHRGLLAAEVVTVVPAGTAIWLQLVDSPPMAPRLPHRYRIPAAAAAMWMLWILGYVVGLASSDSYPAYAHAAHSALSTPADLQFTAGVLWFVPACAYVPVIFANFFAWLRSEARQARPTGNVTWRNWPDRPGRL